MPYFVFHISRICGILYLFRLDSYFVSRVPFLSMSLFRSKKNHAELVIVYDIGSASVGAALVLLEPGKKPSVVHVVEHDMALKKTPHAGRLEQSMYQALRTVGEHVMKEGMPHLHFTNFGNLLPAHAYVTFASPWYASQTRIIHESFAHPKKIKMSDIFSRVEKERDVFVEDEEVVRVVGEDAHTLIEERVVRILVNGYETTHPEGVMARSLQIAVLFSVVPEHIIAGVTEEITRVCPSCDITPNTFPLVAFDVLRDTGKVGEDFLFVDISGEVTDVSLVHDGMLVETETFPVGKKTLIRNIGDTLHTSREEAQSLMTLLQDDGVGGVRKKDIERAVLGAVDVWRRGYEHARTEVSSSYPLPHSILFTSDGDVEHFFLSVLKDDAATRIQVDVTDNVRAVNALFLREMCSALHEPPYDPFLMLGAIFAAKIRRAP